MNELATPIKGTSWTDLIVNIKVGGTGKFPADKESTIRPLISGRVKDKFPEREYRAKKSGEILTVYRLK